LDIDDRLVTEMIVATRKVVETLEALPPLR
jgi:hypothetical protein